MGINDLLRTLFYRPERGFFVKPDQLGLRYKDVVFRAEDGTGLHGWFLPGNGPAAILFMHGAGGNISHRAENARFFSEHLGAHLLLFDYRGYGRSSGVPDEEGTYLDAEAAFEVLLHRPEIDPKRVILYGHSMGGAVAVELALRVSDRICGLVVESSFTTGRDVARVMVPLLPENLIPDFYNTVSKIGQVSVPVLIAHGEQDSLIPASMGRALYAAALEPKTFYLIPGADHHNGYEAGGRGYLATWQQFIDECVPVSAPAT